MAGNENIDEMFYKFNKKEKEKLSHLIGCYLISNEILCHVDADMSDYEFDKLIKDVVNLLHETENMIGRRLGLYIKRV